jgi:AAA domain
MDKNQFLSKPKGLLIAPAGFGKTHFIADCFDHVTGKQLILTHTHAGVASIKQKLAKTGIPRERFQVETISSLAQRFTFDYYTGTDIPPQDYSQNHFTFVVKKATQLLRRKLIADVIQKTYDGLFVDEYQDCTILHHAFIKKLSELIPTRLLGDPMQGIFTLRKECLVDLNSASDMDGFIQNSEKLTEPWRWKNGNNQALGDALIRIRNALEAQAPVDLTEYTAIEMVVCDEKDLFEQNSAYRSRMWSLKNEKSLLIIHPNDSTIETRLKVIKSYPNMLYLLEAFDHRDFYGLAKQIDSIDKNNCVSFIEDISKTIFKKTEINNWIKDGKLIKKSAQNAENKKHGDSLSELIENFQTSEDLSIMWSVFNTIYALPGMKCYRRELFKAILNSIHNAASSEITVEEAMTDNRNRIRRLGRRIVGRCIGTTLLTKGLEFETVGVLNAHLFDCPKKLYVALSRASKRLVVFTNDAVLNPKA